METSEPFENKKIVLLLRLGEPIPSSIEMKARERESVRGTKIGMGGREGGKEKLCVWRVDLFICFFFVVVTVCVSRRLAFCEVAC